MGLSELEKDASKLGPMSATYGTMSVLLLRTNILELGLDNRMQLAQIFGTPFLVQFRRIEYRWPCGGPTPDCEVYACQQCAH